MKRIKVTDEKLSEAVIHSHSVREVLTYIGVRQAGGSHSHYSKKILLLNLDTSHFTGRVSNKGKISKGRRPVEDILKLRNSGGRESAKRLKRALLETGVKYECHKCGQQPEWMGNSLTLDVDHINENWLDDRVENLRFLCPNCHSQFSRNLIKN